MLIPNNRHAIISRIVAGDLLKLLKWQASKRKQASKRSSIYHDKKNNLCQNTTNQYPIKVACSTSQNIAF